MLWKGWITLQKGDIWTPGDCDCKNKNKLQSTFAKFNLSKGILLQSQTLKLTLPLSRKS